MKVISYFIILIGIFSCATTPKGENKLLEKIEADQKIELKKEVSINKGRPIFLEVASYPQFLPNGDIWTGGIILMNIGREDLKYLNIIEKYKKKANKP